MPPNAMAMRAEIRYPSGATIKAICMCAERWCAPAPQVSLDAVIGRNHDKWGERPLLLVELREDQDISDEELLGSLQGSVASW